MVMSRIMFWAKTNAELPYSDFGVIYWQGVLSIRSMRAPSTVRGGEMEPYLSRC